MKHQFEQTVYYSDTDAFGVVWHGSYLRWLEMGRVELCKMTGCSLTELEAQNIVLPVVNINVRYKSSAKVDDELIIETSVQKFNPLSVTFEQKIFAKSNKRLFAEAIVDVVAVDKNGKLYRKMPTVLHDIFEKTTKDEEYALK